MKKVLSVIAALAVAVTSTATLATDKFFFEASSGLWRVFGMTGTNDNDEKTVGCIAVTTWADGSKFLLIQDQYDLELLFEMEMVNWKLTGQDGDKGPFHIVFRKKSGDSKTLTGQYEQIDASSVQVRNLSYKEFFESYKAYDEALVILSDGHSATISLKGSSTAYDNMVKCHKASGSISHPKPSVNG